MWLQFSFHLSVPLLLFHFILSIKSKDKIVSARHTGGGQDGICVSSPPRSRSACSASSRHELQDCPSARVLPRVQRWGGGQWTLMGFFYVQFLQLATQPAWRRSVSCASPPASPYQQPRAGTSPFCRGTSKAMPGCGPATHPLAAATDRNEVVSRDVFTG